VNKFLFLVVAAIFGCGCTPAGGGPQLVSTDYGVCINLPEGATYSELQKRADFETASLNIGGLNVDVMIGGHPPFSRSAIEKVMKATSGFEVLGEERSGGVDKILYGYNRSYDPVDKFYGPKNELVMFYAADLSPIRDILTKKDVVVDCRRASVTVRM